MKSVMKIPDNFLRYFLAATLFLVTGFIIIILRTAALHPHVEEFNAAGLQAQALYHQTTVVPFMASVFPRLLFLNAGVALFVVMVPLFWTGIWWFRRDLLDAVVLSMKGTVCILMVALGHNSFTKVYVTYRLLPLPVVATMYLPHGWLEMFAFILAGTSAFLCIDALRMYLQENGNNPSLHPGDICLFILGRTWKACMVIVILMTLAAAIECWVTPVLVDAALQAALESS